MPNEEIFIFFVAYLYSLGSIKIRENVDGLAMILLS